VLCLAAASTSPAPGRGDAAPWGPILQCLRAESVWIAWESGVAGAGVVEYAPPGGAPLLVREAAAARVHRMRLGDLLAETAYTYTCSIEGEPDEPPRGGSFTTPPTARDRRVSFMVSSDTGALVGQLPGNLPILLDQIRARKPAFVVLPGDMTETSLFAAEYFIPWGPVLGDTMVYTCLGNHDEPGMNPAGYQEYVTQLVLRDSNSDRRDELYYAFDWGPLHVVAVDTMTVPGQPNLGAEQEQFLADDYRESRDRPWRILFTHVPPYTRTTVHYDEVVSNERRLTSVCDQYRFDLVFCGHVHAYERTYPMRGGEVGPTPDGQERYRDIHAPVYVTITSGWKLYPFRSNDVPSWCARSERVLNYATVDADERSLTVEAFRLLDGTSIEKFTIEKTPEEPDAVPPVVRSVTFERMGTEKAVLVWETDEPTEGEALIYYGDAQDPRGPYRGSFFSRVHRSEFTIDGALENAWIDLTCRDLYGNTAQCLGTRLPPSFTIIRGDANLDGQVNIADALAVLYHLFGGRAIGIPCAAAGDVNGVGALDIADAVYTLAYLFACGPPPCAPFPDPGPFGNDEQLPCTGGFNEPAGGLP
jgi:acid phosphatase type 7